MFLRLRHSHRRLRRSHRHNHVKQFCKQRHLDGRSTARIVSVAIVRAVVHHFEWIRVPPLRVRRPPLQQYCESISCRRGFRLVVAHFIMHA